MYKPVKFYIRKWEAGKFPTTKYCLTIMADLTLLAKRVNLLVKERIMGRKKGKIKQGKRKEVKEEGKGEGE